MASGITPSHLDSHHHVHLHWPFLNVTLKLARRYNIRHVRLSRNVGASPGLAKKIYKIMINMHIRRLGLSRTKYFGSAHDIDTSNVTLCKGPLEIMVHPVLKSGRVMDCVSGMAQQYYPLDELIASIEIGNRLFAFSELR
jgi:predicted glycoside hydrolase/deacetylase ChbG (UPF0249 family)